MIYRPDRRPDGYSQISADFAQRREDRIARLQDRVDYLGQGLLAAHLAHSRSALRANRPPAKTLVSSHPLFRAERQAIRREIEKRAKGKVERALARYLAAIAKLRKARCG